MSSEGGMWSIPFVRFELVWSLDLVVVFLRFIDFSSFVYFGTMAFSFLGMKWFCLFSFSSRIKIGGLASGFCLSYILTFVVVVAQMGLGSIGRVLSCPLSSSLWCLVLFSFFFFLFL